MLPLVILIYMMTKKRSVSSNIALPVAALLVYANHLLYFATDPNVVNATVIKGLLAAWTPITIIWGAVLLIKTMEYSGSWDIVRDWLYGISSNRVAQLMVIGWAFAFMIEGASGFGTPAAVAAPILVALGFEPLSAALLLLVMNSVPVSFGAVGAPTWFGMGRLGLSHEQLLEVGFHAALIHSVAALIIPVMGLLFVLSWKEVARNLIFVYLSILSCVVPYALLARINYEFPALVGGAIGFALSILLARKGIGLTFATNEPTSAHERRDFGYSTLLRAFFPIIGTILLLVVTRIPELRLRGLLQLQRPALEFGLGSFGEFAVSAALVLKLENILETQVTWTYDTLFVPAIIPFGVIWVLSIPFFRLRASTVSKMLSDSLQQMKNPIVTLSGALVMVELMMAGGERAQTMIIGKTFAEFSGPAWQYVASFLGALGSFFSGSATVSNLTFSGIQYAVAHTTGLDETIVLSLQSVGGAMGNMVCINNIIAVCSILGIFNQEGTILKRTIVPMIVYGFIAGIVGAVL